MLNLKMTRFREEHLNANRDKNHQPFHLMKCAAVLNDTDNIMKDHFKPIAAKTLYFIHRLVLSSTSIDFSILALLSHSSVSSYQCASRKLGGVSTQQCSYSIKYRLKHHLIPSYKSETLKYITKASTQISEQKISMIQCVLFNFKCDSQYLPRYFTTLFPYFSIIYVINLVGNLRPKIGGGTLISNLPPKSRYKNQHQHERQTTLYFSYWFCPSPLSVMFIDYAYLKCYAIYLKMKHVFISIHIQRSYQIKTYN